MATTDVARRVDTNRPIRNGCAVSFAPGCGYVSMPNLAFESRADFNDTDSDIVAMHNVGRHRLYYTTGAVDPADGT